MSILEALANLNVAFLIEGYASDFTITLQSNDFEHFVLEFEAKHKHLVYYPDLAINRTMKSLSSVKIAGPGSYFLIRRGT